MTNSAKKGNKFILAVILSCSLFVAVLAMVVLAVICLGHLENCYVKLCKISLSIFTINPISKYLITIIIIILIILVSLL